MPGVFNRVSERVDNASPHTAALALQCLAEKKK